MQAFSPKNYQGTWPSFDANWLALGQNSASAHDVSEYEETILAIDSLSGTLEQTHEVSLSCQQLIRFYQHPAKMFAQQQLNLYFENHNTILEDVEPFSVNHLQSYLLRQDLLNAALTGAMESPSTKETFDR